MKKISIALLLSLALLTPSFAKTYKLPEEESFASITIPDDWKSKEIDSGVEAQSADDEVYFYVEATDAKGLDKAIVEAVEYLSGQGVTVDDKSMKRGEGKINGMDVMEVDWKGTDKEGATEISLSVVGVTKEKALLIVYWASPEGAKKHIKTLGEIANSVKAVK